MALATAFAVVAACGSDADNSAAPAAAGSHSAHAGGSSAPPQLAERVGQFADLLTGRRTDDLDVWMSLVDTDGLPALHGFVHGLRRDLPAVTAGPTLLYSNGPIEGANTKFPKRQMYGRAGFALLRQRLLFA